MMIDWPTSRPTRSAMLRASASVGPPAANGTIHVIGLAGQFWAWADTAVSRAAAASAPRTKAGKHCMVVS
ncbi:hypothetical protein D3C86_1615820 [compost metagenome]